MDKQQLFGFNPHFTDQGLIERLVRADQFALYELYDLYHRHVFRHAMMIVEDKMLAEEVTQDVFLKLWKQAHRWQPQTTLRHWLSVLTWHMAMDRRRREDGRAIQRIRLITVMKQEAIIDAPEEHFWEDKLFARLVMDCLPLEQAQAVILSFLEGYTHSQMAALLNLPLGTVKTRVHLGLNKLRDAWKDQAD